MRLPRQFGYSVPFAWLVHWPLLVFGVLAFRASGRTPWLSYWSMRRLYCITHGASNRLLRRWLARPADAESAHDGLVDAAERPRVVDELQRDGFSVLSASLDDDACRRLVDFARATAGCPVGAPPGVEPLRFDSARSGTVRLDLPEHELVAHPVVGRLLADPTLLALAREYLGCEPVNDLVAMWWSAPGAASSAAAQLYHFDMDRPQFLKIFFYLTDVDVDTGPHCYIRGSHRDRPPGLWRDGRHDDTAVLAACGAQREVAITGRRGSVIAVDTSGLHKGRPLARGHRLVLQLEYTSVLFGAHYRRLQVPDTAFWRDELARRPRYYARLRLQG